MQNEEMTEDKLIILIGEAKDTLDRTIGFVNICDSKSSIMLGIIGMIFTIIFTSDGLLEFKRIAKKMLEFSNCRDVFLFLVGFASIALAGVGFGFLIFSLMAKIDCKDYKQNGLNLNSSIYFGNIAASGNFNNYKERFMTTTQDKYLIDLLSQIYLNSCICTKKFERYNRGVIFSICGLLLFILIAIIGSIIY